MIMLLFVGGKLFSVVFQHRWRRRGRRSVVGMDVSPYVVLAIMMAMVFFLGMFIDWAAILVGHRADFYPHRHGSDFNPLCSRCWSASTTDFVSDTAFRLCPVLFQRRGASRLHDGRYLQGHRSLCRPIQILGLILMMVVFPGLITWLPALFFRQLKRIFG